MFDIAYIPMIIGAILVLLTIVGLIVSMSRKAHLRGKAGEICGLLEACGIITDPKPVPNDKTALTDKVSNNFRKKHSSCACQAYRVRSFESNPHQLAITLWTKDRYDAIPEGHSINGFHHYSEKNDAVTFRYFDRIKQYAVCIVCYRDTKSGGYVRIGIIVAFDK